MLLLVQGFLPDVKGAFPPLASVGQAVSKYQMKVWLVHRTFDTLLGTFRASLKRAQELIFCAPSAK